MDREIRVKILPDGKVEFDSTVFKDCKEVAEHFAKILGKMEEFEIKEDHGDSGEVLKITSDE
ncbi:MAG: hypothetical protein KAT46_07610 [Deltaproteobacteria bacterium]|nr:hypothetical protein [Deltaproteobacteria bacterium]